MLKIFRILLPISVLWQEWQPFFQPSKFCVRALHKAPGAVRSIWSPKKRMKALVCSLADRLATHETPTKVSETKTKQKKFRSKISVVANDVVPFPSSRSWGSESRNWSFKEGASRAKRVQQWTRDGHWGMRKGNFANAIDIRGKQRAQRPRVLWNERKSAKFSGNF